MHRSPGCRLDVDPVHGGLVGHATSPETVSAVGGPPGIARISRRVPTELDQQLAETGSDETDQVTVQRCPLPLVGPVPELYPQPRHPVHAANMPKGLTQG